MKHIFSFDIFDTLLTRKVATPSSLFLIVGQRAIFNGILNITPSSFKRQRMLAEEEARTLAPSREANYDEIYRSLIKSLNISQSLGEKLAMLELAVESENLVPVPGALELVQKARGTNAAVYFISDMYLPSPFVRGELEKYGLFRNCDKLYLSNEWRASKLDGTLFRKICESEHIRPTEIHHTGDRVDADFESPLKCGIKAWRRDLCSLGRYERMLEEFADDSSGMSSILAGISRLTRLQVSAPNARLKTLSQIGASVVCPIIALYALWIIREAKAHGICRLYFVARDGYLVKQIADAAIKSFGLAIETRYLYGSRQAWHLPAIEEFTPSSLSWLVEKTRTLSLRIVLSRLHISPEEIPEILAKLGWPPETWDIQVDEEALAKMKTDLFASLALREHVSKLIADRKRLVLRYFEQEGLFESVPWCIVDLGWHGRLQHSLEKLLRVRKQVSTLGLYFGLYRDSPVLADIHAVSYLGWDLRNPSDKNEIPALVFLMESFCTAPHGSTIGYQQNPDGLVVPTCREEGFNRLKSWGIEIVHLSVKVFAEELGRCSLPQSYLEWDSRDALVRLLGTFSRDPLAEEGRAWGAFPYEDEQGGVVCERLTKSYELTADNLRAALMFGEERFIPASWNVLWRGAQPHVVSLNNSIFRIVLQTGKIKKRIGESVRRLIGR